MWLGTGALASGFEAPGGDLIGGLAAEDALAARIVSGIEAAQELLEIAVGMDRVPSTSLRPLRRSAMLLSGM